MHGSEVAVPSLSLSQEQHTGARIMGTLPDDDSLHFEMSRNRSVELVEPAGYTLALMFLRYSQLQGSSEQVRNEGTPHPTPYPELGLQGLVP